MLRLERTVGPIERLVPLKQIGDRVSVGVTTVPAQVFGTTPDLLRAAGLRVARGRYLTDADDEQSRNFAVLGAEVAEGLFPLSDPIGRSLLIEGEAFKVVGVLGRVGLAGGAGSTLVGRDLNYDVHVPMTGAISRFGDIRESVASGSRERTQVEVSEMIVQVPTQDDVRPVASQIERLVELAHGEAKDDVTLVVPLELIEQAERVQFRSNVLMIVIGGLSLFVGGVGIMNIMLASVTERTREIGIRRALGATRRHIIAQFLVETTTLSCAGGMIGVASGLAVSLALAWYAARVRRAGGAGGVAVAGGDRVRFRGAGGDRLRALSRRCGRRSRTRSWRCVTIDWGAALRTWVAGADALGSPGASCNASSPCHLSGALQSLRPSHPWRKTTTVL